MRGSLQLAQLDIADPKMLLEHLAEAETAVAHAAALTQRLLAIGRRQDLTPSSLHATELLDSMASLLRRTLGAQIEIRVESAPDMWDCLADGLAEALEGVFLTR